MLTLPFVRTFGEVREQVTTQGQWAPKRVTRSNGKITRMQCVGVVQHHTTVQDWTVHAKKYCKIRPLPPNPEETISVKQ